MNRGIISLSLNTGHTGYLNAKKMALVPHIEEKNLLSNLLMPGACWASAPMKPLMSWSCLQSQLPESHVPWALLISVVSLSALIHNGYFCCFLMWFYILFNILFLIPRYLEQKGEISACTHSVMLTQKFCFYFLNKFFPKWTTKLNFNEIKNQKTFTQYLTLR